MDSEGGETVYSINDVGIIEFLCMNKTNLDPCLKPSPKNNSRWMVDLKCKRKGNKVIKRSVREQPPNQDPEASRDFLICTQKTTAWHITAALDIRGLKALPGKRDY